MRDIIIVTIVAIGALMALRRPWVGVMLWTWLSLMNPHRFSWGFAYDAPLAAVAAACTLVGLMFTRDKRQQPFQGAPTVVLLLFMLWMTLSWQLGLDPEGDYPQWDKVMKIDFMILLAMVILHSKKHIVALMWVCAASLALLGGKGGVFTIMHGGSYKVYGPPYSFIEDNNHFALALVMTIPLLRFLQMQMRNRWARYGMTVWMILLAAAALGSHSRGALLAISAMTLMMWWRGSNRFWGGIMIAIVAVSLVTFMPAEWTERMHTINTYDQDMSAQGRFSAWWVAWRLAFDYPTGVGFNAAVPMLFAKYSPYPELGTPAAHSIYFQALGNHGFVGLGLFLLLWGTTWFTAARVRKEARGIAPALWARDLAGMCQVSLLGYLVGGAFLSLAYFDLPYNIMMLVVLTRLWVRRRAWEQEPEEAPAPAVAAVPRSATAR
jgi:probable O-glycosylation ligase (exosortase A-associated)